MQNLQKHYTIKEFSEFIYREKSSEFLAQAFPLDSEEEFQKILNDVKKKYYDAVHHCYCVKLYNGFIKHSDDGEPNGSAGVRILNAIEHFEMLNVCVIVIRYFGGTKLGVGPLGKAYYTAAENVLNNSKKVCQKAYLKIFIKTDFKFLNHVYRTLDSHHAKILNRIFEEVITFECLVLPVEFDIINQQLIDLSRGIISISTNNELILYSD